MAVQELRRISGIVLVEDLQFVHDHPLQDIPVSTTGSPSSCETTISGNGGTRGVFEFILCGFYVGNQDR